jgi:hypothetical protein
MRLRYSARAVHKVWLGLEIEDCFNASYGVTLVVESATECRCGSPSLPGPCLSKITDVYHVSDKLNCNCAA